MPNWVPQSPTWFWRITVSPRNSSTRHAVADDGRAQVADVHFLGQVGRRQVDHHVLRRAVLRTPSLASASAASRRSARASLFWKKLRKPGPAISTLLMPASAGRLAISFGQVARFPPGRGLGQHQAMLLAKSPWLLSLVFSTWSHRAQPFGQHALGGQAGQGLLDQVANGVFHGLLGRPRLVENCAL